MATVATDIHGFCDPRFDAVRSEFARNFEERGELGAAVCIHLDGKPVVDLWGGTADKATGRAWVEDTMVVVCSTTKGAAALCINVLIDRGLIEVDAPVAQYWPEFAAAGKEAITVGMVLAHQAGLPYWHEQLPPDGLLDWALTASLLATQVPIWEPGTCHGYHGITLGVLLGEVVRRVSGMTIGQFLREEIASRLDADVWIGLPESEAHRVATIYMAAEANEHSAMYRKLTAEPDWYGWRLLQNGGGYISAETLNARAYHAAEIPAVGGIASARGLARLYAPLSLDGSAGGVRIVSEGALAGMRTTRSASSCDLILRLPTTFTLGFSKSWGARALGTGEYVILGEQAFGTAGMGGSIGFADGQARMSFGYVMNQQGAGVGLNERGQSLIDTAYLALGFSSSAFGLWVA